jgi:hypothetical protein
MSETEFYQVVALRGSFCYFSTNRYSFSLILGVFNAGIYAGIDAALSSLANS